MMFDFLIDIPNKTITTLRCYDVWLFQVNDFPVESFWDDLFSDVLGPSKWIGGWFGWLVGWLVGCWNWWFGNSWVYWNIEYWCHFAHEIDLHQRFQICCYIQFYEGYSGIVTIYMGLFLPIVPNWVEYYFFQRPTRCSTFQVVFPGDSSSEFKPFFCINVSKWEPSVTKDPLTGTVSRHRGLPKACLSRLRALLSFCKWFWMRPNQLLSTHPLPSNVDIFGTAAVPFLLAVSL